MWEYFKIYAFGTLEQYVPDSSQAPRCRCGIECYGGGSHTRKPEITVSRVIKKEKEEKRRTCLSLEFDWREV